MILRVDAAMLARPDVREEGYERISLSHEHIHMDPCSADETSSIYTYIIRHPAFPSPDFPITARYRALCQERQETL